MLKPFKINRNSWHYKLNSKFFNPRGGNKYYMQDNWEPRHNNFCAYWRATMFRVFGVFCMTFVAGVLLVTLGAGVYQYPWDALMLVGSVVSIITLGLAVLVLGAAIDNFRSKRRQKTTPDSLFVQRYKAYKSKVCPMVEYDS